MLFNDLRYTCPSRTARSSFERTTFESYTNESDETTARLQSRGDILKAQSRGERVLEEILSAVRGGVSFFSADAQHGGDSRPR